MKKIVSFTYNELRVLFKILIDLKFEFRDASSDKYVLSPFLKELIKKIGQEYYNHYEGMKNPFIEDLLIDKWMLDTIKFKMEKINREEKMEKREEILDLLIYPFKISNDDKKLILKEK